MSNTGAKRKVAERIGAVIRAERASQRMSQQELAKKAGVSPTRITEIENEKSDPRLSTVESIAGALGLTLTVEAA
jgi:transcriptional regulator with XRE-family HTH domain